LEEKTHALSWVGRGRQYGSREDASSIGGPVVWGCKKDLVYRREKPISEKMVDGLGEGILHNVGAVFLSTSKRGKWKKTKKLQRQK